MFKKYGLIDYVKYRRKHREGCVKEGKGEMANGRSEEDKKQKEGKVARIENSAVTLILISDFSRDKCKEMR